MKLQNLNLIINRSEIVLRLNHKFILLILCISLFSFNSFSQDSISISGFFQNNTRFAKVVIKKFGVGSFDIAATPIKDGKFIIYAPANIESGVYRFQYSQSSLSEYIDIIIDGKEKEISFSLDVMQPLETRKPIFTHSEQNKKWYAFQAKQELQLQKIMALQNALSFYPVDNDKIITQLKRTISKEQKNHKLSFESFISENKSTWAGEMVANKPVYFTNPKQDWRLQDFEKREQFWDNINTTNQALINSPLYTEHILEYIKYYMNPEMQFGEEEMNQGFKKSVDNVMQKFSGNAQTQEFALKYLQLGFKEIGNEDVLQYIDENYQKVLLQCSNENADRIAFEKRISGYATMKIGNNAPNFNLKTPNLSNSIVGKSDTFDLFDIKAKQTLVFFWASWCPHCMEEMPKVNEWAATQKDVKVVAVSLDTDKSLYLDLINQFPNVTHSCDFKGWESQAAVSFFITATPTFILLDEDKKIINKRTSIKEYTQSN